MQFKLPKLFLAITLAAIACAGLLHPTYAWASAAITLTLVLRETWQFGVLIAAAIALLVLRQGVVATLLVAGAIGVVVALAGGPLP